MPDMELIPGNERDEAIFQSWQDGKGLRALAHEFALTVRQVEEILDRMLPAFDAQNQLRAFKREIERLENLSSEFYTIAKRDKDPESAHLVARLNERVCAMRGWTAINIRMDPMATQVAQQPSNYGKIREAVLGFARGPNGGSRAVDTLFPSNDDEPSC